MNSCLRNMAQKLTSFPSMGRSLRRHKKMGTLQDVNVRTVNEDVKNIG